MIKRILFFLIFSFFVVPLSFAGSGDAGEKCSFGCGETETSINEKPQPPSLKTDISKKISQFREKKNKVIQTKNRKIDKRTSTQEEGVDTSGPTVVTFSSLQAAQESAPSKTQNTSPVVLAVGEAATPVAIQVKETLNNQPSVVLPEELTNVFISSKDQNRFVCLHGNIEDIWTSAEKGVNVQMAGSEAYVKLEFEIVNNKIIYSEIPTEFFIRCDGNTFSIIANPRELHAQTIQLVSPKKTEEKTENIDIKGDPIALAVVKILKSVFTNKVSPYWEKYPMPYKKIEIQGLVVTPKTCWRVPGVNVLINVFQLEAIDVLKKISETDFLLPELTTNPIAIAFDDEDHIVLVGEKPSLVIIEKTIEER